jgi:hypothetical protein
MSGPQGTDPTHQWQQPEGEGQQSGEQPTEHASPWQQQPSGDQAWQPSADQQTWHAPAYTPTEYGQYQQPPAQYYPPSQGFPQGYPQQDQYGQTAQYGAQPTQYGQPPQYGQTGQYGAQPTQYGQPSQYGQTGQYGQPGQYGQYPPGGAPYGQPPAGGKGSRTAIFTILGVLAAIVVAAVLVLGFWAPGFFVTTKLDVNKANAGVQQILSDSTNGYGAKNVKDVNCNPGKGNPIVKKGSSFDCDVTIDGTKRSVTVTFQDNKGTYEVGRPK